MLKAGAILRNCAARSNSLKLKLKQLVIVHGDCDLFYILELKKKKKQT